MIGSFYSLDGKAASKEAPLQLHKNFYRAISDAESVIDGKATIVNYRSKFAVIMPRSRNYRLLISEN